MDPRRYIKKVLVASAEKLWTFGLEKRTYRHCRVLSQMIHQCFSDPTTNARTANYQKEDAKSCQRGKVDMYYTMDFIQLRNFLLNGNSVCYRKEVTREAAKPYTPRA
jgi:hypothetical protein